RGIRIRGEAKNLGGVARILLQTAAAEDVTLHIRNDVVGESFSERAVRAWQHESLRGVMRNHPNDRIDVLRLRAANVHEAPPKIVRPTRTMPIPPSIAAFTARNFGIIPPLTKLALRSSSGLVDRSITAPSAFFTPSTSVKKTNSLH